ncbi:putative kinase inhibitor [Marinomonas gallaica]|uniref:Kinase inhibitor n=1 Tax=Marinomonas gallaica TaxID=1806667 RepID=A0A1C3JP86_9GAMM|nr:YbhB/YbcL family Raf kinase inhibitor-like protein [Marinomonas gallaica]SBT17073.1 putative kinase inhibitor [Marinomonas gallaica]SBT20620.1 putative kinase inhibitor [Marinomonas gallaica]
MVNLKKSLMGLSIALTCGVSYAGPFTLTSSDIADGKTMSKQQEFQGFGCTGDNQSPALSWSGAPEGTKAYAILVHDPDAPTGGSGWWHWQMINIPQEVTHLESGAGNSDNQRAPEGSQQIRNDYGIQGFGGACPPKGDKPHRYRFTIYALSQPLDLPSHPSAALTGYMVNSYALASDTIEALYQVQN